MVKVISTGNVPWHGQWKCRTCGRTLEFSEEDASDVCYNLPQGQECTLPWGYAFQSMFFPERMIGPCVICNKEEVFFRVSDSPEEK